MKLSKSGRIGLLVGGVILLLVGWVMWTFESEYNTLSFTTSEVDGEIQVWEHKLGWDQTDIWIDNPEARTPEALEAAGGILVFTGTGSEANRYMNDRHEQSNDFAVEITVLAVGVLLVAIALIPGPKAADPVGTEDVTLSRT